MREHADDALPGLLLFFAQRSREVGEDEELMRLAVAAERRPPQLEASALRAERPIEQARGLAFQALVETQLARLVADQIRRALADQPFCGWIREHEHFVHVEGEHRNVDRAHHALEKRRRFDRLGPLALQGVAKRVDLVHDEIDGASRPGAGAADRIVALA
jgi:hypothetical protein